jgi:ribose/xylose/arabinose/galactoside ABC-type transport system permease subunit
MGRRRGRWRLRLLDGLRLVGLSGLIACGVFTPGFLSKVSLLSLTTATSFVGCVAVGMTFITLGGNIMSFSLGVTLSASTIVFVSSLPLGIATAAGLALAFSALVTGAQGWIIGFFRANPIIVSLASLSLITGLATWITGGLGVYPEGDEAEGLRGAIGPVPIPLIALVGMVVLAQFVLSRTSFGRGLIMVGSNRRAAEVLMAARYGSGDLELGIGYDYSAISALLVGGTAIQGGQGSAVRTMFGAFGIATVEALLVLWGFSTQAQYLAIGVIVLAVVMLQTAERSGR